MIELILLLLSPFLAGAFYYLFIVAGDALIDVVSDYLGVGR